MEDSTGRAFPVFSANEEYTVQLTAVNLGSLCDNLAHAVVFFRAAANG
ncbi:hypothetical protein [Paraburkholderia gardini]|nr:hypothetical protein [Paraburkholderia gardini]